MTTFEKVQQVLWEQYDRVVLFPSRSIVSLDIDSLEKVQLILDLEEALGVEIPNDDVPALVTLQDIVDYADKRSAKV